MRTSRDHCLNPDVECPSEIAFPSGFPGDDVTLPETEFDMPDEILPAGPDHVLAETVGKPRLVMDAATRSRGPVQPGIGVFRKPVGPIVLFVRRTTLRKNVARTVATNWFPGSLCMRLIFLSRHIARPWSRMFRCPRVPARRRSYRHEAVAGQTCGRAFWRRASHPFVRSDISRLSKCAIAANTWNTKFAGRRSGVDTLF